MQYIDSKKAEYLLRQLPYKEWMSIGILQAPKGIRKTDIGSLDELLWTIEPSIKTLATVRFESVVRWLRDSVEYPEFADEVQNIDASDISYMEKSKLLYEATQRRVALLKKASNMEVKV